MTGQQTRRRRQAALATIVLGLGGALLPMAPSSAATLGTCTVTQSGSTYTLTKNCTTDQTVPIPDGATLDGAGHTITAVDGPNSAPFAGLVIVGSDPFSGAPTAATSVRDLNVTSQITSTGGSFPFLYGVGLIAGGFARNLNVSHIFDTAGNQSVGVLVSGNTQGGSNLPMSKLSNVSVHGYQSYGVAAVGTDLQATGLTVGPALRTQNGQPNPEAVSLATEIASSVSVTNSQLANNNPVPGGQSSLPPAGYLTFLTNKVSLSGVTIGGRTDDGDGVFVLPGGTDNTTGTDLKVSCSSITRPTSAVAGASQTYGYGIDVAGNNSGARSMPRHSRLLGLAGTSTTRSPAAAAPAQGTADVTLGGVKFASWRRNVHNAANVTRVPATCSTPSSGSAVLRARSYRVDDEHPIHFFGRVQPGKVGTPVRIQLHTAHGWVTKKSTTQSRAGRFSAAVWMRDPAPGKGKDGPRYFRAVSHAASGKRVVSPTTRIVLH